VKIENIFTQFKKLKVIVVGDAMLDSYKIGNINRQSPEAKVPVVDVIKKSTKLGGAANVILNLKQLGVIPVLCTVIGDDENGRDIIKKLEKNDLETSGVIIDPSRKTTVKERIIVDNKHVVRIDEEIKENLNEKTRSKLLSKINEKIKTSDILIFQDYNKGVIDNVLIDRITSKKKIFISVDPKNKNFTDYKNIDVFKPNLKEITKSLKINNPTLENLKSIGKKFMKKNSINHLMITLSEEGILILSEKEVSKHDIFQSKIVDVSGAGDAIISLATILFYLKLPQKFIGEICNVTGGIVCNYSGVKAIDPKELIKKTKRYNLDLYL
jgi:rfaE bifunctional protein kinase chain/domain